MKINPIVKDTIEWIICITIAIVIALLVRYYIGTPTVVESVSMEPTLYEGQRLWVNRWGRTIKKMPARGEIITFEAPTRFLYLDNKENIDQSNPVAQYENQPQSLWAKFTYYVLEINKISYIKRVIALPGEHVQIKDGYVYINGEKLQEDYLQPGVVTDIEKGVYDDFVVPENTVFAMGDNRPQSTDCRLFGCIPLEKIESTLSFRFWPLNLFGTVE